MEHTTIDSKTDISTGEVTIFLKDVEGGPIVTSKDLSEATSKWNKVFGIYKSANDMMGRIQIRKNLSKSVN
jgi:hypothetical protein